jgi:hypothetical protein
LEGIILDEREIERERERERERVGFPSQNSFAIIYLLYYFLVYPFVDIHF